MVQPKLATAEAARTAAAPGPAVAPRNASTRYWLTLLACIVAIKALLLALDHAPMFYLGDSLAYLYTAKNGYIPTDRSFLYGWIIKDVALSIGSLQGLLISQSLAGVGSSMLCAYILRRFFRAGPWVAAIAGLLCAIEPLQLLLERYVMTEAFSLLAFSIFVTACLAYLERASLLRLIALQAAAVFVVAMRVSFLPILEVATVLAPLLAWRSIGAGHLGRWVDRRWVRVAGHLLASLALFGALQLSYTWEYAMLIQGALPGARPAYNYDEGFHVLSFVAPILKPEDFPDQAHAAEVFDVPFDLKDPRQRDRERWEEGGLVYNIVQLYPDPLQARRLAKQTATNGVRRDPLGEMRLAWYGFADYWNLQHLEWGMVSDRGGDRPLPEDLLTLLHDDYHLEGAGLPRLTTVTNVYYYGAWWWFLGLLLLPLPMGVLVVIVPRGQRAGAFLLLVFAGLQWAVIAACSIGPTVRFLHAMGWLALLTFGIFAATAAGWRARRGGDAPSQAADVTGV